MQHLADGLDATLKDYEQRRDAFGRVLYSALFGFSCALLVLQERELPALLEHSLRPWLDAAMPRYVPWALCAMSFVLRTAQAHRRLYGAFIEPRPTTQQILRDHQPAPLAPSTPAAMDSVLPAQPARPFVPRKVLRRR